MGDKIKVIQRVRFPPFGTDSWKAAELPISEAITYESSPSPGFVVGDKDGWFVERIVDSEQTSAYSGDFSSIVNRQRRGWYLIPHPIHAVARKFITFSVAILLLSLLYLAITPILENAGIPTFGTTSLRLGLLDYPSLAVIVVPLMMTPIALRIGANLGDLRRQKSFLYNAPKSPVIEFDESKNDCALKGRLIFPEKRDDWGTISISWRVGVLPPSREAIFKALGRNEQGQPPPGLATPLPHYWERGLDDGTGTGEDVPMQRNDLPGGIFLRPLRMMALGGRVNISEEGMFSLDPPADIWPGSFYSELIRIHWEIVIKIRREKGGPLLWVQPLMVGQNGSGICVTNPQINDGRSETVLSKSQ
jgi:hypothetical protein